LPRTLLPTVARHLFSNTTPFFLPGAHLSQFLGLVPNRLQFHTVKAINGRASDGSFLNFSEFVNITCVMGVMGTDELMKVRACGRQHCHPYPALRPAVALVSTVAEYPWPDRGNSPIYPPTMRAVSIRLRRQRRQFHHREGRVRRDQRNRRQRHPKRLHLHTAVREIRLAGERVRSLPHDDAGLLQVRAAQQVGGGWSFVFVVVVIPVLPMRSLSHPLPLPCVHVCVSPVWCGVVWCGVLGRSALWSLEEIQMALRQMCMGDDYWLNKIEHFRVVRKQVRLALCVVCVCVFVMG